MERAVLGDLGHGAADAAARWRYLICLPIPARIDILLCCHATGVVVPA
jgi:hypothetical protein